MRQSISDFAGTAFLPVTVIGFSSSSLFGFFMKINVLSKPLFVEHG